MYTIINHHISTHHFLERARWNIEQAVRGNDGVGEALKSQAGGVDHRLNQLETQLAQAQKQLDNPAQAHNTDKWKVQIESIQTQIDQLKHGGQNTKGVEMAQARANQEAQQAQAEAGDPSEMPEMGGGSRQTIGTLETTQFNGDFSTIIKANKWARKHLSTERLEIASQALNFLQKSLGYSANEAVGIVANLVAESGMNINNRGKGIANWIEGRKSKMQAMLPSLPGDNLLEKQLSFLHHELQTTEARAGSALSSRVSAEENAKIFLAKFERPKVKNTEERQGIASALKQLV